MSMSSGVFYGKTLSADGHGTASVDRTHTRTRSSTIGGMSSQNGFRSRLGDSNNDIGKRAAKLRKSSNQALASRYRSNSNANEIGRPTTGDGSFTSCHKSRASILVAASDVLGLKLGRRKPSMPQRPESIVFPDVIDISAARVHAEVEERNRLRDMAAQAIGLHPYTDSCPHSHDGITDVNQEYQEARLDSSEASSQAMERATQATPDAFGRSPRDSTISVSIPYSRPSSTALLRSGSVIARTAATTTSFAPIPPYPSTVSSLSSFRQCAGMYPKYYPPSSLRIFALSRNWKSRYLMMSSPATFVARGQSPAVSYLHVFKSANLEEEELERLEINEDSVVFVAEEEAGGKRSVIKVGGTDVGAMKKEYMVNEGGHSVWLLHIQDTAEAHRLITNIKNAILGQRTVRAGLIPAYPLGVNEPRGDMDVMLSIRTQGIVTPTAAPIAKMATPVPKTPAGENSSLSSRSAHSFKARGKRLSSPKGAVSALKGLFTARPKSVPRAAYIDAEKLQDQDLGEESLANIGHNLLNMLRSSTPDSQSLVSIQSLPTARTNIACSLPVVPVERYLDRKILPDPHRSKWESTESTNKETNKTLSLEVVLPLQPPPRKRWASGELSTLSDNVDSRATSLNMGYSGWRRASLDKPDSEPTSAHSSSFQFGTPEQRPRASSLQSISTYASGDRRMSIERSSSSTRRSSNNRRWSKQGITQFVMPPLNDPLLMVAPHANRTPSPNLPLNSQRSFVSALPTFSKRTSGSESCHSANSSSMYPPVTSTGSVTGWARNSIPPPPHPAPTSALPPAPTELDQDEVKHEVLKSLELSGSPKVPFRTPSSHRSSRLSLIAPKPPPNSSLPPRPDEPEYNAHHRRSSSGGSSHRYPTALESIPTSSLPPGQPHDPLISPLVHLPPPPPPPSLPLPVPPVDQLPPKRVTSLKQRLRMLSGPVGGNAAFGRLRLSTDRSILPTQSTLNTPPSTPIAEKIMPVQDDSFLQMCTPIMPTLPTPPFIPEQLPLQDPLSSQDAEGVAITSLSPPPRRGSKQMLETDFPSPKEPLPLAFEEFMPVDEQKHLLLSPPLSPSSQNSQILPDVSEKSTLAEELSTEDSSGFEDKSTSCVDSANISLSRPSSIISLGIMSI